MIFILCTSANGDIHKTSFAKDKNFQSGISKAKKPYHYP